MGVGCADAVDDVDSNESQVVAQTSTADEPIRVPDPKGVYFVNVLGTGNGCRKGSYNASISSDGLALTVTFSEYYASVNIESAQTQTKNCILNLEFNSPAGLSVAVTGIYYTGYAFLEEGVIAEQKTNYAFTGLGINVEGQGVRTRPANRLVGPYDKDFVFQDNLKTTDLVFSECGQKRVLQVRTELFIQNSSPKKSGYASISAIDAETKTTSVASAKPTNKGKLVINLATKGCPLR